MCAIFVEHGRYNCSFTMMAKPMKTLELYYSMIMMFFKSLPNFTTKEVFVCSKFLFT